MKQSQSLGLNSLVLTENEEPTGLSRPQQNKSM